MLSPTYNTEPPTTDLTYWELGPQLNREYSIHIRMVGELVGGGGRGAVQQVAD